MSKEGLPAKILTPEEKQRFLNSAEINIDCNGKTIAGFCRLNIRDVTYSASKDEVFGKKWAKIIRSRPHHDLKKIAKASSLVIKSDLILQVAQAGFHGLSNEFVATLDITTKDGRKEYLAFLREYVKMLPIETASDVVNRTGVAEEKDFAGMSVEVLEKEFASLVSGLSDTFRDRTQAQKKLTERAIELSEVDDTSTEE